MAGLEQSGFKRKRLSEIREDMRKALEDEFGTEIDLSDNSVFSQLIDPFAAQADIVWEAAEELYSSFDPEEARGSALDNLGSLIGVDRKQAEFSRGDVTFQGEEGATIPVELELRYRPTNTRFVTTEEVELPTENDGDSTSLVDANIRAEDEGPIEVTDTSGDFEILNPIDGLDSVVSNTEISESQGNIGQFRESDAEYRSRRELEIGLTGAGTEAAISAKLREIANVDYVLVISNRSEEYDHTLDMPPHSVKPVLYPDPSLDNGVDEELVFYNIFNTIPAGIETVGDAEATVTDITDQKHTIKYQPATEVPIEMVVEVDTSRFYPSDGDTIVKDTLVELAATLNPGDDVYQFQFLTPLHDVQGLIDADIKLGEKGGTVNEDDYEITREEVATLSRSDITVNEGDGDL